MGTILTIFVLLAVIITAILAIRRDRKRNKCAGCHQNCTCK